MSKAAPIRPIQPGVSLLSWRPVLSLAFFAILWVDLVRQLSYTWEANEQYAYGWFVPVFSVALFLRRWPERPQPQASSFSPLIWLLVLLPCLALLPVRVVHEINPDWPLTSWLLTLFVVELSLLAVLFAGGWRWVKYFAFPVCFILVAVQWPYRIEKGLTQNLMQLVATLTVEILGWFDIPAMQRGNLIELSTGVLGVDEACSGIRSFQSTLMAALFLGELYRLRWLVRLMLVGAGLASAFLLNVCRTLFLTWQANTHGISAVDKWHDPAGMTIAIGCFGVTWLIAVLIQKRGSDSDSHANSPSETAQPPISADMDLRSETPDSRSPLTSFRPPRSIVGIYLLAIGAWSLVCIGATEVWYRANEIENPGSFQWTVVAPETRPGFQKIELPERSVKLLSFDSGSTSKWEEEDGSEFSLYFFRWNPRSIQSVINSRTHRPEVCLPASGYTQVSQSEVVFFDVGSLKLPFRKYTYSAEGRSLFVFFCQWEDGAETQTGMGASAQTERLRTVWVGRRLVGHQTLEIIITGPSSLMDAEDLVRQRLPELIRREEPQSSAPQVSKPVL